MISILTMRISNFFLIMFFSVISDFYLFLLKKTKKILYQVKRKALFPTFDCIDVRCKPKTNQSSSDINGNCPKSPSKHPLAPDSRLNDHEEKTFASQNQFWFSSSPLPLHIFYIYFFCLK